MRAGYDTNDYDNRMTDEELGPPHHSLSNLNNNAIRLVIKDEDNSVDDSDGLVVMSHTEPNEGGGNTKQNSRNIAKKSYQTVAGTLMQPGISKAEFLKRSKQELSFEVDNSISKNVYKN